MLDRWYHRSHVPDNWPPTRPAPSTKERLFPSRSVSGSAAPFKRFNANDNIAEFTTRQEELENAGRSRPVKMQGVLDSLVIDTENDHNTQNTAAPVAKMYLNGVFKRPLRARRRLPVPNAEHLNELMIVGPLTVRSACSHHFFAP